MLDHVGITVANLGRSRAFYAAALAPLGVQELMEHGDAVAFGIDAPQFWILEGRPGPSTPRVHIAFAAATHLEVETFHRAALEAGGSDHGAPGYRPQYHEHYYAAFVLDPDGHNVEAVCRRAP
jgi:catechol 2,3-dioxygenase-like lactoylglutathione lyase family enzyme